MGFKREIDFLILYYAVDMAFSYLNSFIDFGYYSLADAYEDYYSNHMNLQNIVISWNFLFQLIPLILARTLNLKIIRLIC